MMHPKGTSNSTKWHGYGVGESDSNSELNSAGTLTPTDVE